MINVGRIFRRIKFKSLQFETVCAIFASASYRFVSFRIGITSSATRPLLLAFQWLSVFFFLHKFGLQFRTVELKHQIHIKWQTRNHQSQRVRLCNAILAQSAIILSEYWMAGGKGKSMISNLGQNLIFIKQNRDIRRDLRRLVAISCEPLMSFVVFSHTLHVPRQRNRLIPYNV